jgi:hypothetical protein
MRGKSSGRLVVLAVAVAVLTSGCFYHQNVAWDGGQITNRETITETFAIGPFSLAPMSQPGWEVLGNPSSMPRPDGNIAIKGIRWDVVDGDGMPIPISLVHLHHIVMIDQSRPDPLCPSVGARFTGAGMERVPLDLLGDYAYMTGATDVWRSTFHIHSTSMTPVPEAYIQYKIIYEEVDDPSDYREVTPYFLDVTGCWGNSEYDVPGGGGAGSVHIAERTYTARADGIAVFAGGHTHAGGLDLQLTRQSTGEDYCTATARYTPGTAHPSHPNLGQLSGVSRCLLHSEIEAGEQFTLTSRYDNEYPVPRSMGIMLTYVWHP